MGHETEYHTMQLVGRSDELTGDGAETERKSDEVKAWVHRSEG